MDRLKKAEQMGRQMDYYAYLRNDWFLTDGTLGSEFPKLLQKCESRCILFKPQG